MATSASRRGATETQATGAPAEVGALPASGEPSAPHDRHAMIAEAAFFMAEARGFAPNQELDDWLTAEREIEQRLPGPGH